MQSKLFMRMKSIISSSPEEMRQLWRITRMQKPLIVDEDLEISKSPIAYVKLEQRASEVLELLNTKYILAKQRIMKYQLANWKLQNGEMTQFSDHKGKEDDHENQSNTGFQIIGQRCSFTGNNLFKSRILNEDYNGALRIAERQVRKGAEILSLNMDEECPRKASERMEKFLEIASSSPRLRGISFLIDSKSKSTKLEIIKMAGDRGIANNISLEDGTKEFISQAKVILEAGSKIVVKCADEKGIALTIPRKLQISKRAYQILKEIGFLDQNIIIDLNVLPLGHSWLFDTASNFIFAVHLIRDNLGHKVSILGGISNATTPFRGNRNLREAINAVLLHEAEIAGLNMAIMNPDQKKYSDLKPEVITQIKQAIYSESKTNILKLNQIKHFWVNEELETGTSTQQNLYGYMKRILLLEVKKAAKEYITKNIRLA